MTLTSTQIRCILAILSLTRMEEDVASKNIARLLGITKPSVHKMLDVLSGKGLLEKEPYGAVHLTPAGLTLAEALEAQKEDLLLLFSRGFGLPLDESSTAAALLMSELSQDSLNRLCEAADKVRGV